MVVVPLRGAAPTMWMCWAGTIFYKFVSLFPPLVFYFGMSDTAQFFGYTGPTPAWIFLGCLVVLVGQRDAVNSGTEMLFIEVFIAGLRSRSSLHALDCLGIVILVISKKMLVLSPSLPPNHLTASSEQINPNK